MNNCSINSACTNTIGSYQCSCLDGYLDEGLGYVCTGMDPFGIQVDILIFIHGMSLNVCICVIIVTCTGRTKGLHALLLRLIVLRAVQSIRNIQCKIHWPDILSAAHAGKLARKKHTKTQNGQHRMGTSIVLTGTCIRHNSKAGVQPFFGYTQLPRSTTI